MLTSSIEMTSSGLVIASTRLPLSSTRSGMRRWRTMKSRGSRPMAPGWGALAVRSTTPMRICPARALTMSISETMPSRTRTSPRRPPSARWCSRAVSSCFWLTRPLATSRAPSLRRPAERCLRPAATASSLRRRSSGRKGLVTNSAAPRRCAFSNVWKSPRDDRAITGVARSSGEAPMRRSSSSASKVSRSRSRMTADGEFSRSSRSVPGSPRLVTTSPESSNCLASSSRRSGSLTTMATRGFTVGRHRDLPLGRAESYCKQRGLMRYLVGVLQARL